MTSLELSHRLESIIQNNIDFLKSVAYPAWKPQPDKWSAKEIIGHLIDSANNNHRRFVKAQYQDNLIFIGYDQDDWVREQNYQEADWEQLIDMWKTYNLFICKAIENISDEKLNAMTTEHNYFQIGWGTRQANCALKEGEASNLAFLIEDYIGHMEHHLRQVREHQK